MTNTKPTDERIHYICQTYTETTAGRDGRIGLKISKQFEYAAALEALNRAEREALSEGCVGADAYMICEDPSSGEVGGPSFLKRLGNVSESESS
ncbi:hypothetical protein N9W17_02620 [Jannaschia sp.]|nr:hypothetical protein [Jannaschia sp.]